MLSVTQLGRTDGLAEATAPEPTGWTAGRYILVILVLGVPAAIAIIFGAVFGQPLTGGAVAALPFGLLILMKPEIGLYLLAAYLPFEGYSEVATGLNATRVLGVFTLGAWLMHAMRTGRINIRMPELWLGMGFAVWSILSILVAAMPEVAWVFAITRFMGVGLFFLVVNACVTREQAKALFWIVFLSSIAAVLVGFAAPQVAAGAAVGRVTVGGWDENAFARVLMSGLFMALFLLYASKRWLKVLVLLGVLVVLTGIARTGSRSAYIALAVGAIAAILTWRGMGLGRRILLVLTVTVGLAVFVVVGTWAGLWDIGLGARLERLREMGLKAGGRLQLIQFAWRIGLEHPVLGVGIGNFLAEAIRWGEFHGSVHNDFLSALAETGFPGLFFYVAFLIAVLRRMWRVAIPWLRVSLIGMFVSVVVSSTANPTIGLKTFWLQMGACAMASVVFGAASGAQHAPDAPADGGQPASVPHGFGGGPQHPARAQ